MKRHIADCCILLGTILWVQLLFGQSLTSMSGTISDVSNAVVPRAEVDLINVRTNALRVTTSNSAGFYAFPQIRPGTYDLEVKAIGFATKRITAVELRVNSPATLNVKLALSSVKQKVTVSAAPPLLNTTNATLGNAIGTRPILQLPLFARNPTDLLAFQAGVVTTSSTASNLPYSDYRNGAVDGTKSDQSNITLDGIDDNNEATRAAFTPVLDIPLDSVEEFRTTTLNATAAEGRSAGPQVALVTKSGTNAFHGSLYEYNRNTATSANNFFNNRAGVPTPALLINIFGGSVGGPIKKNKAFFFFNYEGDRNASAQSEVNVVPRASMRQGFINYITTAGTTATLNPAQITSQIDPLHIGPDPAIVAALQQYPLPNDFTVGDGLNTAGFRFDAHQLTKLNTYVARFDYDVNSRNTLFWRGTLMDNNTGGIGLFPGQPPMTSVLNSSKGFAAGWTRVIGSNFVSSFRAGLTREAVDDAGLLTRPATVITYFTNPFATTSSTSTIIPVYEFKEDMSWIHGNHSFSFGGVARFIRNRQITNSHSYNSGEISCDTLVAECSDLDPSNLSPVEASTYRSAMGTLLGLMDRVTSNYNYSANGNVLPVGTPVYRDFANNEGELYVSDSWKAAPGLTLTGGVRWSLMPPPYEVNGQQASTVPVLGSWFNERGALAQEGKSALQAGQINYVNANGPEGLPMYPFYKDLIAPRVGLAYSPQSSSGWVKTLTGGPGKTVIRAGWGMFYDDVGQPMALQQDTATLGFSTSLQNAPGVLDASTAPRFAGFYDIPSQLVQPAPTGGLPQVAPNAFAINYGLVDGNLKIPYTMNMNFTVERQLPAGIVLQASYVGNQSRRSLVYRDLAVPTNLTDPASHTGIWSAFNQLSVLARKNTPVSQVPAISFWENMWPSAAGNGLTATQNIYQVIQHLASVGDFTDSLVQLDSRCNPACSKLGPFASFSPQYSSLSSWGSIGWGSYNSLQVNLRKRWSQGLTFDFNWTWGKSMDLSSNPEADIGVTKGAGFGYDNNLLFLMVNPWDPGQMRAVSDYDVTHMLNAFAVWDLPFGTGQRFDGHASRWLNALIGGWQLTPVWYETTGFPIGVRNGRAWPTDYRINGWATPIGLPVQAHKTLNGPYGPNMFSNPTAAVARYGDAFAGQTGQRNGYRGDGNFDIDLGLGKRWTMPWNEKQSLQIRCEVYNVTNSVRFDVNTLSLTLASPLTFGTYSGTLNSPRQMQFVARYEF